MKKITFRFQWRNVGALLAGVAVSVITYFVAAPIVQSVMDQRLLAEADPVMISLADQAGMSRKAKLVFLRTQPKLVSDADMQHACRDNTAANNQNGFIEQGCYVPAANRIYLRHMPANLHQLEITTAAYEMLHPVYIDLHHGAQGEALDTAIEANYERLADTQLKAQVANFARTEPGARDLELFSLLATGYTHLSNELTQYYVPYFDNLHATLAASQAIDKLFQQSQDQLSSLQAQINQTDKRANDAYATSVKEAKAGNAAGNDKNYNLYRQYLTQENAYIGQYNTLLVSYNKLVTEYNGSQPVQQIAPAPAQAP